MLKTYTVSFLFKDLKGDTLNKTVIDALDRFICHAPDSIVQIMSVPNLLFALVIFTKTTVTRVQSQTLKCKGDSCAGHARDVATLDPDASITLWIAPDDAIVTRIPDRGPVSCPGSSLRATVTRAPRLSSYRVVLRPMCLEGLVLQKTPDSVLVDSEGPTYCALVVLSAEQLRIRDITFDHGECINATAAATFTSTADRTAAVVLRPLSSRLDSETSLQNLTFAAKRASVAVLLTPPSWDQTLQLNGPAFEGFRGNVRGTRLVALLVTGRLTLAEFHEVSAVILRDPVAGFDRPTVNSNRHGCLARSGRPRSDEIASSERRLYVVDCHVLSFVFLQFSLDDPVAVAVSLVAILTMCVVLLLLQSCRSTEAEDLAPYRVQDAPLRDRTKPTS